MSKMNKQIVIARVKVIQKSFGLENKDFSLLLDIDQEKLEKFYNGEKNLSNKELEELSKNSGRSLEWIMGGGDTTATKELGVEEEGPFAENLQESTSSIGHKTILYMVISILVGFALAAAWAFLVQPYLSKQEAKKELLSISANHNDIIALNTNLYPYLGENKLDLSTDQKGLGIESIEDPASFIFGNGKRISQTLEVFMDFSEQKSRDFILANQIVLKNSIEKGEIILKVYPLIGDSPYAIYSTEALSEGFYLSPENSWTFFIELLKKSAEIKSDNRDTIINSIINVANNAGIPEIDAVSIARGTFVSWLISGSEATDIEGKPLPVVKLDGKTLDITNNFEELRSAIENGL